MLWKYKKCYQENSEDVIIPPPSTDLRITSSVPESGIGVINITGGQPNETINLYNEFINIGSDSRFNTTPLSACGPPLDSLNGNSTGVITLDITGNLSYSYNIQNINTVVKVTITNRSSAEPLPTPPNNYIIINIS